MLCETLWHRQSRRGQRSETGFLLGTCGQITIRLSLLGSCPHPGRMNKRKGWLHCSGGWRSGTEVSACLVPAEDTREALPLPLLAAGGGGWGGGCRQSLDATP